MKKQTKKKRVVVLVNGLLFFILICFFIFIHEFGHYISALLLGFKDVTFIFDIQGLHVSTSTPIVSNQKAYIIFAISGSLFDLPFILLSLYYGKKKRIFGLYSASWTMLLSECIGWFLSPIINHGDASLLLRVTPILNSGFFILAFLILLIFLYGLFLLDFYHYSKKRIS